MERDNWEDLHGDGRYLSKIGSCKCSGVPCFFV